MKVLKRKNNLLKFSSAFILASTILLSLVFYYIISKGLLSGNNSVVKSLATDFKIKKTHHTFKLSKIGTLTSQKDILKWLSETPWKFDNATNSSTTVSSINNANLFKNINISTFSVPLFKATVILSVIAMPLLVLHLTVKPNTKKRVYLTVFITSLLFSIIILTLFAISLSEAMAINDKIVSRKAVYLKEQENLLEAAYKSVGKTNKDNSTIIKAMDTWTTTINNLIERFKNNSHDKTVVPEFNVAANTLTKALKGLGNTLITIDISPK